MFYGAWETHLKEITMCTIDYVDLEYIVFEKVTVLEYSHEMGARSLK